MLGGVSHKAKQFFFLLIKISIVITACYFIYRKLYLNDQLSFSEFSHFLIKNNVFSTKNIIFLLVLTGFNWFFEILKWRNLVNFTKPISFFEALTQSLAAHTTAIFTPNRIGGYGVKAMYYTKLLRRRILLLNFISNTAQMSVTLIVGVIGLSLFILKYEVIISIQKIGLFLSIIVLIAFVFVYLFSQKLFQIKGLTLTKLKLFVIAIGLKIHLKNICFSVIRYFIFSFQYYYLLLLFGVEINYITAMVFISSMYLLSSIIPTLFIFDAVIKGSIGIYLFSFLNVNELIILSISMLMWLLNFALPTGFGSIFILKFKPHQSLKISLDSQQ